MFGSNVTRREALRGVQYFLTERDDYTIYCWCNEHPRAPRWMGHMMEYLYSVISAVRCLPCVITGHHDLVDDGYATPDSGCIRMGCDRCGWSWPTTWLY